MFTVEIKINGSMIIHIYGHNESETDSSGRDKYSFEYYEVETKKIQSGTIYHNRGDGICKLIELILTAKKK